MWHGVYIVCPRPILSSLCFGNLGNLLEDLFFFCGGGSLRVTAEYNVGCRMEKSLGGARVYNASFHCCPEFEAQQVNG